MDESWERWFSDMEKDECHLFNEHNMNSLEGENSVQPELSWGSLSFDSNFSAAATSNNLGNASSLEEKTQHEHAYSEKPNFSSHILSFENSTVLPIEHSKTKEQRETRKSKMARARNPSQSQGHIIAERKRRENLTRLFVALSAITPGLKKMDKLSILNNAIDHVKNLQNRVKDLEEEKKKKEIESVTGFKNNKPNNATVGDKFYGISDGLDRRKTFPEVEAIVSAKDVLIRVICDKRNDVVTKLLSMLAARNLSIICCNVLPFGNSTLNISIIAKVGREFNVATDDLVKNLNEDLLKCFN